MLGPDDAPDPFRFRYALTGVGWATATVSDGHSEVEITASYLTDALADYLETVIHALDGDRIARRQAFCSWMDEPGSHLWLFDRRDDAIRVELYSDRPRSMRPLGGAEEPDTDDTPSHAGLIRVVHAITTVRQFASEVREAVEQLYATHGAEEYEAKWAGEDYPFPIEALRTLRRLSTAA